VTASRDLAALIGRIMIAALFVPAGWGKIGGFAGTAGYVASKGLPFPEVGAGIAVVCELIGGLMILVGWKTRWAALALAVFTLAAAIFFHPFWVDPQQSISFWKNVGITGGLLILFAHGAGRLSLDRN